MRTFFKILGAIIVVLLVVAAGVYLWVSSAASRIMSTTFEVHSVDFPIPVPLSLEELTAVGATDDAGRQAAARDRAVERGKHLMTARYACTACHGTNFGGGVMVDAFPLGSLLAPNLTTGPGSRTASYQPRDWDRIVRHGVLPDGTPAVMPSEDFERMSDQELSDVVSYIRSLPPVSNTVPKPTFGPLGKFLLATGEMTPSAMRIDHRAAHVAVPPAATASAEFGRHLAGVCVGCHQADLSGGPIVGGDPSWPPARNITPASGALGGWTFDQFVAALREGKRPDGTALRVPMTFVAAYAKAMTDTELQAIWEYLKSIEPITVAAAP